MYGKYTVNLVQEGIMPNGLIQEVTKESLLTQCFMGPELQELEVEGGVGSVSTTQASVVPAAKSLSFYQAVSRMIEWIWAYIQSLFGNPESDLETTGPASPEVSIDSEEVISPDVTKISRDNQTPAEKLFAFKEALRNSSDVKMTKTQRRAAYDALPDVLKATINIERFERSFVNGHNRCTPSLMLDRCERVLSRAENDKKRLNVITTIVMDLIPDSDCEFNRDLITTRIKDLFFSLPDTLKNEISEAIWAAVLNPMNNAQDIEALKGLPAVTVDIKDRTLCTDNADFGSLVFVANPYGPLVINGITRLGQNYNKTW